MRPRPDGRLSNFAAGLVALAAAVVVMYFGFTKALPVGHHYTVRAVFRSSNLVVRGAPVRIAGVNVGKVTAVGRYEHSDLAVITMRIDPVGRPLHVDATAKARPRLFLEGNFYVDLRPGTPGRPELGDGGTIPVAQTATPVQLDQVLTALQSDTRDDLRGTLAGLGGALSDVPPSAAAGAGLTGAQALNRTLSTSPASLRGTALVADGLRGRQPGDLMRTVRGLGRAFEGLGRDETQLQDLVDDFDTTTAAFADEGASVRRGIAELASTSASARRAFATLHGALGPSRRFARLLAGSITELPATITAAGPWLTQARQLLTRRELGGLLAAIRPSTASLARLTAATQRFLPGIDRFNRCITKVIIPTGDVHVDDGALSAGTENYKEFWYAMVGQAGESQSFDGNGQLLRLQAIGGGTPLRSGKTNDSLAALIGSAGVTPLATRPAYGNELPPMRRDVPCMTQRVPDVNGPASRGPADGSRPDAPAPSARATSTLTQSTP